MLERYSHIRMEKRKAVDTLSGQDFEPSVAYCSLRFVPEKSDEANSLKSVVNRGGLEPPTR